MGYNKERKQKGRWQMGMGYGAYFEWVVEEEKLKQVCEEEYGELSEVLKKFKVSFDELASAICYQSEIEVEEEEVNEIFFSFDQLVKRFKEKTDLTLHLGYHDSSDSGDRYDELDGYFFAVDFSEIYELTPVAKKAKEQGINIRAKTYVSYG
jgi:hypothetical protein